MAASEVRQVQPTWVVHLCPRNIWELACVVGEYTTDSLEQEGFIHCSRPDQVLWVANNFYSHQPDLVLLWIDPQQLSAETRWETVDGQSFPHVYGPINLKAVQMVVEFLPDPDGVFRNVPKG
jgi:uncharacterized protein (DUF952 family)